MSNEYKLLYTANEIDSRLTMAGNAILYTEQTLTEEQKAQARANIGAISKDDNDASESGYQVQADWNETDSSAPSFIKNKPYQTELFGVPQSSVSIDYSEDVEFNAAFSAYRIWDAPESIYDLLYADITYYEDDVQYNGMLYHTMFTPAEAEGDLPADFDGYAGAIIDYSMVYPNVYLAFVGNNLSLFIVMADTSVAGNAVTAGIWASAKTTNDSTSSWIDNITYVICSRLSRKFLPNILDSNNSSDSGSGAHFLDMTTMTNSNDNPVILSDGATYIVEGTWGSSLRSAIVEGKPLLVKIKTEQTDDADAYLVGSSVYVAGEYPSIEFSGMFTHTVDSLVNVYKFLITFVVYGTNGVIVSTELSSIAGGATSPASNIKYVDFGSSSVDLTAIDYSQYTAGDLILCLKDVT